jgi:single-stranded-DNA-specific exonuclease
MLAKKWLVAPPAPDNILRQYKGVSPVLAQILYNRGLVDPNHAQAFLTAEEGDTFNPFDMTDMAKAVGRAKRAIEHNEAIIIYGDFDADGTTSTALLMQVFRWLGATRVYPYIPHRVDEGYGLNVNALRYLARRGADLVITVDCGIRSVEEVAAGNQSGLDIIITDHHSLGPELPNAFAVVNPKRDQEPVERMLAGVGVAYKFAEALTLAFNQNQSRSRRRRGGITTIEPVRLETLLDLVAIGTVADLAPLDSLENRLLVRRGLRYLNQADRPGVRALLEVAGIVPGSVEATSIGFGLGPRINAAGRLDSAMLAYELLYTNNTDRAQELAARLQQLNQQRRDLTRDAQDIVSADLEARGDTDVPLIFASSPEFQPGIVGLVAGRITESYFRPTVVMREGTNESTASCRSIPQFDITQALDQCADLLVRHGGHAQAAGLTVLNQNVEALRERLMHIAAEQLDGADLRPTLEIDTTININHLSEELVEELKMLEPTGHHNHSPVFMVPSVYVTDIRTVGSDNNHLKLKLARAGQPPLDAIGFNLGAWAGKLPEVIDAAFALEINEWNGRRSLQLNLKDIRPAEDT